MEHKKILELIESVDPQDDAALDEIDARVWCWLNREKYLGRHECADCFLATIDGAKFFIGHKDVQKYTRSRDALKAIRPEGWCVLNDYSLNAWKVSYRCVTEALGKEEFCSKFLPTEELAELSAIIQAISFERELAARN